MHLCQKFRAEHIVIQLSDSEVSENTGPGHYIIMSEYSAFYRWIIFLDDVNETKMVFRATPPP